jgi:hypothetical protein
MHILSMTALIALLVAAYADIATSAPPDIVQAGDSHIKSQLEAYIFGYGMNSLN